MRSFLSLQAVALLAIGTVTEIQAATLTSAGVPQVIGYSYDTIGIPWRDASVVKTNDVDGDNILGTLGYWLAKTNTSPNESVGGFDVAQMTYSAPAWVTVTAADATDVNKSINYGYRSFQNPLVPTGKQTVGYMGRRYSSTLAAGTTYSLYRFTIGSGAPSSFGLTVAFHNEGASLTALQLTQIAGSGTGTATVSSLPANGSFDAMFITFSLSGVQPGDVFELGGQTTSTHTLMINGLMLDGFLPPETVTYRETFNNSTATADLGISSQAGWNFYVGSRSEVSGVSNASINNNTGSPTNAAPIASGATATEAQGIFRTYSGTSGGMVLLTREMPATDIGSLLRYQWRQGNQSANTALRPLIEIGGVVYVCDSGYTNAAVSSSAGFASGAVPKSFSFAGATWRVLTFASGQAMTPGTSTVPLPGTGTITAIGLYWAIDSNISVRVDTFEVVTGTPSGSAAPAITAEPQSLAITAGSTASFSVAATGNHLSYQWKKNGTDIPSATSASHTIAGVSAGDAGDYTCLVSNSAGSDLSTPATLTVNPAPPTTSSTQWKNLDLRGMGFVTGILAHPSSSEIYARTDVAGIFRWDAASARWIALLDDYSNQVGATRNVESFALDPNNPNRLFVAFGAYVEDGSGTDGLIRSDNKGLTWSAMSLPASIEMGGNSQWRHCGERLVVDPANSNVVYLGTRQDGLWRSTDAGMTWLQIAGVPLGGNNGATRNELPVNGGITFVTLDSSATTSTGGPLRSSTVYLGIMDVGVYRSTDGGNTFALLGTQPDADTSPIQGKLASDGTLYVTLTDGVWRWRGGTWTTITPPVSNFTYTSRGWSAVAVDPANPNRLAINDTGNTPRDLFISTDAGASWIIHSSDSASAFPSGKHRPVTFTLPQWIEESQQKFSWSGAMLFAPGNPNQLWATTGYAVYVYQNLAAPTVVADGFSNMSGLEELVGTRVLPLPAFSGGGVFAGAMDKSGFVLRDPEATPAFHIGSAPIANSTGIAVSALTNTIVASLASGSYSQGQVLASDDGGQTWRALTKPFAANPSSGYGMTLGGDVAVSATDPGNFVWIPLNPSWYPNDHPPVFSTDGGQTWSPTTGLPTYFNGLNDVYNGSSNVLVADAVNGSVFYAYYEDTTNGDGSIYRSTDGGTTWALRADGTLPANWRSKLVARPGTEGEIWFLSEGNSLRRSTDGGATFASLSGWTEVDSFGFGAALPGESKNTIYVLGTRDGVNAVYYSVNDGASWVRPTGFGPAPLGAASSLCGDLSRPGRIYFASSGRGFFYVDIYGSSIGTAPTFTQEAASGTNPVTTASSALSALASDAETPEASLAYSWSTVLSPPGGSVSFSASGSNSAKTTTATFGATGNYTLRCTVTDTDLRTTSSDITIAVQGLLGALMITPPVATLSIGESFVFEAIGTTTYGLLMNNLPALTWSSSGGGSFGSGSTFTAGSFLGGPYTITASSGSVQASAQITITPPTSAITAVHWRGSYVNSNYAFRTSSTQTRVDLNSSGGNNDSRRYIPWSETIPYINPGATYGGASARFYGGLQFLRFGNNTAPSLNIAAVREGGISDGTVSDAIVLRTTVNSAGATHAHFVWLKPDFLETAAMTELRFTSSSQLRLSVGDEGGSSTTKRWSTITNARWLVREGTQWYVSQTAIPTGTSDKILTFASDSSDGLWAPVDPAANLNLDLGSATYSDKNFSNLTGFGYYLENDAQASNNAFYGSVDEFFVAAAPVLPTTAAWQIANWPGMNEASVIGPAADPDGDGLSNLLEYALGSSPTNAASRALPVADISTNHLTLNFTPQQIAGLRYHVEASSDLFDWSDVWDITSLLSPGQPYIHLDNADLTTTPRRFLRLNILME